MKEIKTEIEINAPIETVWETLTDINHWQDWCEIMIATNGDAKLDNILDITMIGKDGKDGPNYQPTITHFDAPNYFRWRAKMMASFLFTNDKVFELTKTETGTKLVHIEAFSGIMVMMFWSKMQSEVPGMLNRMNAALKAKLEK